MPTPVGLATWLAFENLLPSHIYDYTQGMNPYLLNIQPIADMGASQEKIFLVRVNKKALIKDENFNPNVQPLSEDWKTVFIFKVLRQAQGHENFKLDVAEKGELAQVNSLDPRFPIISYAERKGYYIDQYGKMRNVQLLHAAQGQSLFDIWVSFFKYYTDKLAAELANKNSLLNDYSVLQMHQVKETFERVGQAIGAFHTKFLKKDSSGKLTTLVHGDLHMANIFYNSQTKRVTLIDNATVRRDELGIDIRGIFLIPMIYWNKILNSSESEALLEYAYRPFLKEYLAQFPEGKVREEVRQEVQKIIDNYLSSLSQVLTSFINLSPDHVVYFGRILNQIIFSGNLKNNSQSLLQNIQSVYTGLPLKKEN